MTSSGPDPLGEAIAAMHRGDLRGARQLAEDLRARSPSEHRLHSLLGTIAALMGDLVDATNYLCTALEQDPADIGARVNLVRAMNASGNFADIAAIAIPSEADRDASMTLWRLRAYAALKLGDFKNASDSYVRLVTRYPGDFESWNNLGNAYLDQNDFDRAIAALHQATVLRPRSLEVRLNLAAAMARGGQDRDALAELERCTIEFANDARPFIELGSWLVLLEREADAIAPLSRAVALQPSDPDGHVRLALALVPSSRIDEAEQSLRTAISLLPTHQDAHLKLAILMETNNRVSELERLAVDARDAGVDFDAVAFIEALVLRRGKRWQDVLARLSAISVDIEPVRTAHLRGEALDRLGNADAAWDAFVEMNRQAILADLGEPSERALRYESEVRQTFELMTPKWCYGWRSVKYDRDDPVFLVGSPRSGTTLLDTLLMAHERVLVLEEQPPLRKVAQKLGDLTRLPDLGEDDIAMLRNLYFEEVEVIVGSVRDQVIIDKFPLHLNRAALIHRLFPSAKFIFAERHPMDVVLSTFITNFRLNYAMCNYLGIVQAARLYDLCMSCWYRSRELMPIEVHHVRYERVVASAEEELSAATDFLGLEWSSRMLDNYTTAMGRGNIKTASYSQVTEEIYSRAAGRWVRYRSHLDDIVPLIAPWVDRLQYPPL